MGADPAPIRGGGVEAAGDTLHPASRVERSEDQILLLSLRLESLDLDVTLSAWPGARGTLLPLGALAEALGLDLHVDGTSGIAAGTVLSPARRFRLVEGSESVLVNGRIRRYDRARVEWHSDDVYVDATLLADWLPVSLTVDLHRAAIDVKAGEPLPILERRDRERRAVRLLARRSDAGSHSALRPPYRAVTWPASDHAFTGYRQDASPESQVGFSYASLAAGDLLWLETHGFVAGDDRDPLRQWRLTMGRRDPDAVLLGPLRAREFAAGDVFDPGLELVSLASAGKGALLSSFPLAEEGEYDRRTLRGELPPGWDVELYRNDALIGYMPSRSDGLYEFTDVPLLYGSNLFRLEFHGPQGQSRRETRTIELGRSLTPPGESYYRAVAHSGTSGGARARAEWSTGLTRDLAVTGRVATLRLADGDHAYAGGGVRTGWEGAFVRLDAVADSAGGQAAQAAVAARFGRRFAVSAQRAWLAGFESEVFRPLFGPIVSRTGIKLDLEPSATDRPRVPTSFEWRRDELSGGGAVDDLIHQVTTSVRGVGLANRFQWRFLRSREVSVAPERRGVLFLSRSVRAFAVRGAVEYGFEHGGEFRALDVVVETARFGPAVTAGLRRDALGGETDGHVSLTRARGRWGMVLRSGYGSISGAAVQASVSLSLDRDPRTGQWRSDARPGAETGAISANVFLDDNGNGRRDPAEEPLEGVRLRSTQSSPEAQTNAEGTALLRGLPNGLPTQVSIVQNSLGDPLRIPVLTNLNVVPRAGRSLLVDFPVLVCGEVAGTVRLRRGETTEPLAGALLELVSERDGRVVRTARSAFDGYYDLPGIVPGRYRLRATPGGAPRFDVAPVTMDITIGPDGPILDHVDLTLVRIAPRLAGEDDR